MKGDEMRKGISKIRIEIVYKGKGKYGGESVIK